MRVMLDLYPNGKHKALTMSYDDGTIHDRRLAKTFDEYGIRGSFHLNSGNLGKEGRLTHEELPELFKNHEISCHAVTHPFLEKLPRENVIVELLEDRRALERDAGYTVRGMSYPYGTSSPSVVGTLRSIGIEYSRTTHSTGSFGLPEDFLLWHPTCHHKGGIVEKLEEFDKLPRTNLSLFYVWGHSYEFANNDNWELIEDFCRRASKLEDVWFATNIEIVDYVNAVKALRFGVDCTTVYNPSAISVWINIGCKAVEIKAGERYLYKE